MKRIFLFSVIFSFFLMHSVSANAMDMSDLSSMSVNKPGSDIIIRKKLAWYYIGSAPPCPSNYISKAVFSEYVWFNKHYAKVKQRWCMRKKLK